jgi:prophage tail gpP-like protein
MTTELAITVTPPGGSPVQVDQWQDYSLNLGVKAPTASFSLAVPANSQNRAALLPGHKIEVSSYGAVQLTGLIDERSEATRYDSTDLMIAGRCVMGLLLDSVVPHDLLSIANLTVADVAVRAINQFPGHFTGLTTNLAASRYRMAGGQGTGPGGQRVPTVQRTQELIPPDEDAEIAALLAGDTALAAQLSQPRYKTVLSVQQRTGSAAGKVGINSPYFAGIGEEKFIKHRIKLGTTWYGLLSDLCAQIGAHLFSSADGYLTITRPSYDSDPTAYGSGIQLLWDAQNRRAAGGNVLGVEYSTSLVGRCSEYIVAGLGKAEKNNQYSQGGNYVPVISGGKLVKPPVANASRGYGNILDPGPGFWSWDSAWSIATPRLQKLGYIEARTTNTQRLTRLVRRRMAENALAAFQLTYQVQGHYAPTGILWVPDTCINVLDQRNKLSGSYYIHSVKRTSSMKDGRRTTLKLWPRSLWLTDQDEASVGWDAYYRDMAQRITW